MTFVGIDVGAARVHVAALGGGSWIVGADELSTLPDLLRGASAVAIDAPAETSTSPHRDDVSLGAKFRAGRCAEIALGREHGSWVPWVAPPERPSGGWMATGFAVYEALAPLRVPLLEVFPYAGFRALARGRRLPRKSSREGRAARVELLRERAVDAPEPATHDELDALLAALVAREHAEGRARRVGCGHDDSAIWLPARC